MDEGQWGQLIKDWFHSSWFGYICFLALAIWGGTASYISRVKRKGLKWSTAELIGEWVISGLAGMLAALLGVWLQWPFELTAFSSGIAGHMGGRALFLMDGYLTILIERAKGALGIKSEPGTSSADDR